MKTIQFIIEAAILLTLIIVCVLLAGKRTVAVDGDVQLSHSQVNDIVDAIEGEGGGEKQWEYKVVLFGRGDWRDMEDTLGNLGRTGWEYAGPLANNGINAQYVAFMKPKRAQGKRGRTTAVRSAKKPAIKADPMDKSTQDPQGADEKSVEDAFKKEQQGVGEDGDKDNPDK